MSSCIPQLQGHLDLFPFDKVRRVQDLFLEDARKCMEKRMNLLAHAPTGMGKTAVSLTAALEVSIEIGGVVLFLTSRQTQHAAAMETLLRIHERESLGVVDIVSREDMCLSRSRVCDGGCYFRRRELDEAKQLLLSRPMHVQYAIRKCLGKGVCPYLACMAAVREADVVVGDYNHLYSTSLMDRLGRRAVFVIVDEAHNLPSRIMDAHTFHLDPDGISHLARRDELAMFREDLLVLEETIRGLLERHGNEEPLSESVDELLMERCGTDTAGLASEMGEIGGGLGREMLELVRSLEGWNRYGEDACRYADRRGGRLRSHLIAPLAVSSLAFEKVTCSLLMSGTLHPPGMYADMLGIERRVCREYPNPFPLGNRLILSMGGVSSRFSERNERTYAIMGSRIAMIANIVPGNLVAFFPSYHFLDRVARHVFDATDKTMAIEKASFGKNERDSIVTRMGRERDILLMASVNGSFSEGVDFHDNMLDAVVVAGFPLNPPSVVEEARRRRLEKRLGKSRARQYLRTYSAVSKVLQAAGRAIRSETDRAVIILIDDRYRLPHIHGSFPPDFRPLSLLDPYEAIRRFVEEGATCRLLPPPGR